MISQITNVNRIILVLIDLNTPGFMPKLNLFHYYLFFDEDKFIGVTLENKSRIMDLDECFTLQTFKLLALNNLNINAVIKSKILEWIGYNLSIDEILDEIVIGDIENMRNLYLETLLYYKIHQEGKIINKYKLNIRHFDDLINQFSEDFCAYEIISNNKDFSESEIKIDTYLTLAELSIKFRDYLIC